MVLIHNWLHLAIMAPQDPGRRAVILIADDEPAIRTLLELVLSSDGHEVQVVADGREALNYLKNNTPDLVILDVAMPFADGIDVCGRIKRIARFRATPVMLLTAYGDEQTRMKAELARADLVVSKPLSGKSLRQVVRELLEKGASLRAQVSFDE